MVSKRVETTIEEGKVAIHLYHSNKSLKEIGEEENKRLVI